MVAVKLLVELYKVNFNKFGLNFASNSEFNEKVKQLQCIWGRTAI